MKLKEPPKRIRKVDILKASPSSVKLPQQLDFATIKEGATLKVKAHMT